MKHASMAPRRLPVRSMTFALTLLAGWPVLAGEPLWPEPAVVAPEPLAQQSMPQRQRQTTPNFRAPIATACSDTPRMREVPDPQPRQRYTASASVAGGSGERREMLERVAPPAPPAPPAPASAAQSSRQTAIPSVWQADAPDTDADLFASAMAGVQTMSGKGRDVPQAAPPRPLLRKESASDPLQDFMDGKVEFSLEFTDEYLQGHIVGLDSQIINKMKAGEFSSEAHLDLHGLNAAGAWEALVGFFRSAYHKGLRCVLVVPGRGLNSPGGAGVLRERLQTWFTQAPFKYAILAFCTALPKHGGAGALYVLLRKQKKSRGKIRWDIIPADADLLD